MSAHAKLILVKSQFVQTIACRGTAAVWHSLFGKLKMVPSKTLALLDEFLVPKSLNEIMSERKDEVVTTIVQELIDAYCLIPLGFDERAFLARKMAELETAVLNGSRISSLGLIVSEKCNFHCNYCMHFATLDTRKRENNTYKFMRFDKAKEAVDLYLSILRHHGKTTARISFSGGEPLLAWPIIEQVLAYCVSSYDAEFAFSFSLTTNASLITPAIAQTLKKYGVELASSLDGLKKGNDSVRRTKTGSGTFEMILAGLRNLQAAEYPLPIVGITLNEKNFPFLDEKVIDLAVEHGIAEVRIDVDVINMVGVPIEELVHQIMQIRRYAQERGIAVSGFWERPAKNLKKSTIDPRGVAFCGAVQGKTLCVSPSGDIYGCGYSNVNLSSLTQIENLLKPGREYHRFVQGHATGAIEACRGCIIEGQCNGGCSITQEVAGTQKISLMCNFYRRMTQELLLEEILNQA